MFIANDLKGALNAELKDAISDLERIINAMYSLLMAESYEAISAAALDAEGHVHRIRGTLNHQETRSKLMYPDVLEQKAE